MCAGDGIRWGGVQGGFIVTSWPRTVLGKPRPSRDPQNPPGTTETFPVPCGSSRLFPPFPPLIFPRPCLVRAGANHPPGPLKAPISSAEVRAAGADWAAEVPAHQAPREGGAVRGGRGVQGMAPRDPQPTPGTTPGPPRPEPGLVLPTHPRDPARPQDPDPSRAYCPQPAPVPLSWAGPCAPSLRRERFQPHPSGANSGLLPLQPPGARDVAGGA